MLSIHIADVPQFLRKSAFFSAIEGDDETIEIPSECYKANVRIKDNQDLIQLLSTLRFWGVDTIPREVVWYVVWKRPQEVLSAFADYKQELRYLSFLEALCIEASQSSGKYNAYFWGYSIKHNWSADPATAAAQVCLIQYDSDDNNLWTEKTTGLAARLGQLPALRFLHEHGCPWDENTCCEGAKRGQLSCLQYAHEHGCAWDHRTSHGAASNGHLACLKYVCENGCPLDLSCMGGVVQHRHCHAYLRERGLVSFGPEACEKAASSGDLVLLTQLRAEGCPWNASTCAAAARAGSLACLQYARNLGCPWDSMTATTAAEVGSLVCLKYALEEGGEWDEDTVVNAAYHLPCLKYLHENEYPWKKTLCENAAYWGNCATLAYAHEQGCPWDGTTCTAAAQRDKLHALQYAHEHGCLWDARTVNAAAAAGNLACLRYALEQGCPGDANTCNIAAAAHIACLQLAHKNGCSWDVHTCAAAAKASKLDCLEYLHQQGCPWDASTPYRAVRAGNLECLQYAHAQGCAWEVPRLLAVSLSASTRQCLEYVREQAPEEAQRYDADVALVKQQRRLFSRSVQYKVPREFVQWRLLPVEGESAPPPGTPPPLLSDVCCFGEITIAVKMGDSLPTGICRSECEVEGRRYEVIITIPAASQLTAGTVSYDSDQEKDEDTEYTVVTLAAACMQLPPKPAAVPSKPARRETKRERFLRRYALKRSLRAQSGGGRRGRVKKLGAADSSGGDGTPAQSFAEAENQEQQHQQQLQQQHQQQQQHQPQQQQQGEVDVASGGNEPLVPEGFVNEETLSDTAAAPSAAASEIHEGCCWQVVAGKRGMKSRKA